MNSKINRYLNVHKTNADERSSMLDIIFVSVIIITKFTKI